MKKDEIIQLLKEQLDRAMKDNKELLQRIDALLGEVSSLKEALLQKGESLEKQKRINKGLTKIISNKSEIQAPEPPSQEELKALEEERDKKRKARKNNGAKRDMHYEMEVEEHDVFPDDPEFDISKAREFSKEPRICIRYECVPMRFIKHVYKIRTYTQDGKFYEGKTPKSAFLNSSYDGSFIAGLLELRYIHSLPVERIINYFEDHGFNLNKPTAHKLIERASLLFENLYKCIRLTVLKDPYISADETYYRILIQEKNKNGKGVRKGYLWAIVGMKCGMMYLIYENGSRTEEVIIGEVGDYIGIIQSDGYAPYRKLGSDAYPNIIRIACIQHMKRKLQDCGENDPDAKELLSIMNRLFHEDHKHIIGVDGWTVEDHLEYRRQYAPGIIAELSDRLDEIEDRGNLLPKSDLQEVITYIRNEWNAMVDIFNYGDTNLENNTVERFNRYLSISRRNSLFFGSHKGAERGAILYTIALSCKMQKINFFEYLSDVINRTADWQPNTPIEKYRELLPDRWRKD